MNLRVPSSPPHQNDPGDPSSRLPFFPVPVLVRERKGGGMTDHRDHFDAEDLMELADSLGVSDVVRSNVREYTVTIRLAVNDGSAEYVQTPERLTGEVESWLDDLGCDVMSVQVEKVACLNVWDSLVLSQAVPSLGLWKGTIHHDTYGSDDGVK